MTMYDEIIEILESIRSDVDFRNETDLIDGGILDSFDVVSLASEILDRYDVQINVADLVPENFNSVQAIVDMIERKQND